MTSPPCERLGTRRAGEVVGQHGGQQQALAPHRGHPGQPLEPGAQAGAGGLAHARARRSASMTASVARAADMASGWPPNVLPWSPGTKAAATSARAQQAPTGMPLPSALAMVTTSGSMPRCWKANQRPVRPSPVWISSTISSTSRSVHSWRRAPR